MAGRGQGGASNVDPFDAYFRRADLDRDGRISGTEAVSFFQGANLPKNVLAQIWNYADQNRTGFLGRAEFYNALRLVTVAQSKRELTSDIVKAALYSPASAKIPAPQINLAITPTTQTNAVGSTPPAHLASTILPSQSPGPRTMSPQFASMGQQYNMSLTSQSVRPPISVPLGSVRPAPSITSQGLSGPGSTFGSNLAATGVQMGSHGPGSGLLGSVGSLHISSPGPSVATTSTSVGIEQKEPALPNGYSSFGGDVLSAAPSQVKNNNSLPSSSGTSVPVSSRLVPGPGGPRSSVNPGSLDSLQRSPIVQQVGGLPQRVQSVPKPNQPVSIQRPSSGPGLRPAIPAPSQPHQQWPRISQFDVQKYTKVFVEVDADKDGKITGEQARNLFLSWRLPREILKQVWDLSDQDNDSMLSLREFCIALYLMERYREGSPLPSVLPNNILHDMHLFTQPTGGHGHASWGSQQMLHASSARHVPRPPGKPPLPVPSHVEERSNSKQQKLKVPVLEKQLVDQLSEEEQKNLNSKFEEATEANKKVEELEKEIKESREKIEFCRTKMQELVLYKSRCDNRLNEITARVAADKREAEMLAMKYEETYREKGDVASKLTLEEATFRDIQERKMELYRAIVKLEQDGGSGDKFKGHVDQIQSNLEELVKSLNQRCKNYGLRGKPMTVLELPFGWQPGIQEGAADWDEYWDKFEDEGFTFVKELTVDVQNVIAPSKTKTKTAQKEKSYNDGSEKATATSDAEAQMNPDSVFKENGTAEDKAEASNGKAEHLPENGTAHDGNEAVTAKSSVDSASTKSALEISQDGFSENHYDQVVSGSSPRTKDVKSEHKGFGEPAGGSFNNNDDNGSVWASTAVSASKDNDDLFGPGGLALNPIKTGSLFGGDNVKGSSVFADSVPSTPLFPPSFSPSKINEASDNHHAPTFSRFDSFRSTDSGFQPSGTLARFDSMRSSKDFDHGGGFSSFDDSDPFGSGPFRSSSLGTETPRSEVDPFGGSSSLKVSLGSETPRSDLDPFGGGPFRSIFGGETPRTDSDPFGRRSSFGSETPRAEMDSFGAGPLKSSFGSETPRGEMDYSFGAGPLKSTFGSETPRGEMDYSFGAGPFASSFGSETPRSEYEGFGSVGPFKSSFGSETPRSDWMGAETPRDSFGHGGLFMSSMGSETPRSEIDPFGSSGPFRSSFGAETPRRDSEPDPFGGSGPFKSSFANETPRGGTNNWSAF